MALIYGSTTITNFIGLLSDGSKYASLRVMHPNQSDWDFSSSYSDQWASIQSIWTTNSIITHNTIINASFLDTFHYRATIPSDGIISTSSGHEKLLMDREDSKLVVSWAPDDGALILENQWYSIASNISYPPNQSKKGLGIPLNWSMNTRFNLTLKNLDFSFSSIPAIESNECPPNPYPEGFVCEDGVLVAKQPNLPGLVIPPVSGVLEVYGNISVDGPIVFEGLGSSLTIYGCLTTTEIRIDLKKEKIEKIAPEPIILIIQNPDCPNSLHGLQLNVKQNPKSCTKVKVKRNEQEMSKSVFSVVLALDKSACNVKWIIVGCVVGLAIITMVLIVIWLTKRNEKFRLFWRPYSEEEPRNYTNCCYCN